MIIDGVVINVVRGKSGAYFATSPDIKGLQVAAMTRGELDQKLPKAIAEMKAALDR